MHLHCPQRATETEKEKKRGGKEPRGRLAPPPGWGVKTPITSRPRNKDTSPFRWLTARPPHIQEGRLDPTGEASCSPLLHQITTKAEASVSGEEEWGEGAERASRIYRPRLEQQEKDVSFIKKRQLVFRFNNAVRFLKSRPLLITVSDYLHDYVTSNVCGWITWKITGWLTVKQSVCWSCSLHVSPNPHSAERANHMQCMFKW